MLHRETQKNVTRKNYRLHWCGGQAKGRGGDKTPQWKNGTFQGAHCCNEEIDIQMLWGDMAAGVLWKKFIQYLCIFTINKVHFYNNYKPLH